MADEIVRNPAQLPPKGTTDWQLAINASTEVMLASVSFLVALVAAQGASYVGLFRGQPLLAGPAVLALTGLTYLAIERLMASSEARAVTPLLEEAEPIGRCVLFALGGILLAQVGAALISQLQALLGVEATEQQTFVELVERRDQAELIMLGISAVILAPLTEELLFRYMLFRRLTHTTGLAVAYGVSAVAFSAFHFNPSGFVIYMWLALVFAATYRRSGRIWVAMLTHAGYNATAFAILVWGPTLEGPV